MGSPFFGLDIGASALRAAQQLLDTAAHNVSNANTPGYSRQAVTLTESPPYSLPAFNRSGVPGQVGSGVTVAAITRVRDSFLDLQVQVQAGLKAEWDTKQQQLAKIEAVFPEPSDSGLGGTISQYWNAWQDVASDPTSAAARAALTEQAASLAEELNRDSGQLSMTSAGIDSLVGDQVASVNSLATQVASLNGQIMRVMGTGGHANDLMDQREQLLEQLTAIVPATVYTTQDGSVTVLVGGTDLVTNMNTRKLITQQDAQGRIMPAWSDGKPIALQSGQLQALLSVRDGDLADYRSQLDSLAQGIADATNAVQSRGFGVTGAAGQPLFTYRPGSAASTLAVSQAVAADPRLLATSASPNTPGDGSVAGLMADLRNAWSYAAGVPGTDVVSGSDLTTNGTARLMTIVAGRAPGQTWTFSGTGSDLTLTGADGSTQTITVPDMAAGSSQTLNFNQLGIQLRLSAPTDAKAGADLVTDLTTAGHNTLVTASLFTVPQTTSDFYAGLVGKIGTASAQAQEISQNQQLVVDQLQQRVAETSGVSLDEEATDMLKFQHAYQAAARVITIMDEMLNTLINNTGMVGR